MTVIAYSGKHGQIATDTERNWDGLICPTGTPKVFAVKHRGASIGKTVFFRRFLVAITGQRCEGMRLFAHTLFGNRFANVLEPYSAVDDVPTSLIVVELLDKACWKATVVGESGSETDVSDHFATDGSGHALALGALHAGATPAEAVAIACKVSQTCGGPMEIWNIAEWANKPDTDFTDILAGSV